MCALRPSFLPKVTLIWHHLFATCPQIIAYLRDFGALYPLRFAPNFYEIQPFAKL